MVPFRVAGTVGIWGHYCLHRASTGRGSAKGFSFIFPSSAQSTILVSTGKEDVMLAGGAGLSGEGLRPRATTWLLGRPADPTPPPSR